jgi:hypothetical protein
MPVAGEVSVDVTEDLQHMNNYFANFFLRFCYNCKICLLLESPVSFSASFPRTISIFAIIVFLVLRILWRGLRQVFCGLFGELKLFLLFHE